MRKEPAGSFFYCRGFSIVELIVIITIIGVLSVLVGARISDTGSRTRAFYDELLSQVQFARKVAVAQRRPVFVRIEATQSRVCYSAAGTCTGADAVASPGGQAPFTLTVPAGVAPTVVTFQFDALGRPRNDLDVLIGAPLLVTVSGDGSYQIAVNNESGYVQ